MSRLISNDDFIFLITGNIPPEISETQMEYLLLPVVAVIFMKSSEPFALESSFNNISGRSKFPLNPTVQCKVKVIYYEKKLSNFILISKVE